MNWYKLQVANCTHSIVESVDIHMSKESSSNSGKMIKTASASKSDELEFKNHDRGDGYNCKIQLSESKNRIVLKLIFISDIYSFPLFTETWHFYKDESDEATKAFKKCVKIVKEIQERYEEEQMPGPTLQGVIREEFKEVDVNRKKYAPSRSLEAVKENRGEESWLSSLYGNRVPEPGVQIRNSNSSIQDLLNKEDK